MHQFIQTLHDWYINALHTWGAPAVGFMMAMESTIVPIPSEIIIPPAAYWSHTGEVPVSLTAIIIAGIVGSWLGASIMYWASRLAGRPLVVRYGKYFLVSEEKIVGAERWSSHYGAMGIFISRFLPVVRHLIGIPAGIVRMSYWKFSLYTILGSGIWCGVLCYVGIKAGQDEQLMSGEIHRLTLWLAGAVLILGGLYYFFVHRQMAALPKPDQKK